MRQSHAEVEDAPLSISAPSSACTEADILKQQSAIVDGAKIRRARPPFDDSVIANALHVSGV